LKRLAYITALVVLLLNIVLEYWLAAGPSAAVIIPGLADFRPAFNHGISFSLFTQDSDTGRYALMAVVAAICAWAGAMAWRSADRLSALGFGLVLGGGLGNLLDRVLYHGGVFDFLSLHLGSMPLFICNFADIAISLGAACLVLEWAIPRPQRH
jgi:signal peptidase II